MGRIRDDLQRPDRDSDRERRPAPAAPDRPIARLASTEQVDRLPVPGLLGETRPVGPAGGDLPADAASSLRGLQGGGAGLPPALRHTMETALGSDFSAVRVHRGAPAAQLNRRLGAVAFTAGSDIVLGNSAPSLSTEPGHRVLAHELAHVLQNRGQTGISGSPPTVGSVYDREEREADAVADSALGRIRRSHGRPPGDASESDVAGPEGHLAVPRLPAPVRRQSVIRRAYADLPDKDQEAVDHEAADEFAVASVAFEQRLGQVAARSARARKAADELLDRSLHLAEANYFNNQVKGELTEYLADKFGIKERADITGTVGPKLDMILEVFKEGTFREKMSMFYVAMAERQSLNGLIDDYLTKMAKEDKLFGPGGAKEDTKYHAAFEKFHAMPAQALPEPKNVGGDKADKAGGDDKVVNAATADKADVHVAKPGNAAPAKFGQYGLQRKTKLQFKRLVEFIVSEIALERHIRAMSAAGIPAPTTPADELIAQRTADEEIAAIVIEKLTGGQLAGDETTDAAKKATIRQMVRGGLGGANPSEADSHRVAIGTEFTRQAGRQSAGYSWLELQSAKPFADAASWLDGKLTPFTNTEIDIDSLRKELRKAVVETVFSGLGGNGPPDASLVMKKTIPELQELVTAELSTYKANDAKFTPVVKAVKDEVELIEARTPTDRTAETLAAVQFQLNLKANHTFFAMKSGLEHARKGTARSMAADDDQKTDQTPADIQKEGGDPLTYRELGAAFYTPDEFEKKVAESKLQYRTKKGVGPTDPLPPGWSEEFRAELMTLNQDKKLPWKPGAKFWKLEKKSDFAQAAKLMRVQIAAGLSGTTDRVMRAASLLGFAGNELEDVLLACLGWMLPARDHSYYEILKAAEPYLDVKPTTPFPEPLIDPQYANGYGYRKMVDFFPELADGLPDSLLSLAHKDELAKRLTGPAKPEGQPEAKGEGKSTTMSIQSTTLGTNAEVGKVVGYSVRNPAPERRYEWFFIRHGAEAARAVQCAIGDSFQRAWKHPGVYKLYCVVHDSLDATATPVATLRYDETVVGAAKGLGSDTGPEPDAKAADLVRVVATFTDWHGVVTPLRTALATGLQADDRTVLATLSVPKKVPSAPDVDPLADPLTLTGSALQPAQRSEKSETATMFNQLYRKPKNPRLLHAEAALASVKNWQAKNVVGADGPGAINVTIVDARTEVILKEHFFAVNGAAVPEVVVPNPGGDEQPADAVVEPPKPGLVPAYRVQGGDFKLGISSSVRLVNAHDQTLGISGNAAVWVNFTDKARMVWWLSNRSDGSYSVAFSSTPGFLEEIRKVAVPEADANKIAAVDDGNGTGTTKDVKVNAGKPIISQDKAAYQYAIARQTKAVETKSPSLEDMAVSVVGKVVKLFQWKSFDIDAAGTEELPTGKGSLAQEFNEHLQRAHDLELKKRFLKSLPLPTSQLASYEKHLEQQRLALAKERRPTLPASNGDQGKIAANFDTLRDLEFGEGANKWEKDYRTTLRKPGADEVSRTDRRLYAELSPKQLDEKKPDLKAAVEKVMKAPLGKGIAGMKSEVLASMAPPEGTSVEAFVTTKCIGKWNTLRKELREKTDGLLAGVPDNVRKPVIVDAINELIKAQLTKMLQGLPDGARQDGRADQAAVPPPGLIRAKVGR